MSDLNEAAARLASGETYAGDVEDCIRVAQAYRDRLAADEAERAEREMPIDEAWLRSLGWREWDERDDVYSGELYFTFGRWLGWDTRLTFHLGCVEAVRMCGDDEASGIAAESVILLGEPCSRARRVTRGQLLDLLRALGVSPKAADEANPPPAWHDKPTGPGIWFVKWLRNGTGTTHFSAEDIESHTYDGMIKSAFGPIPTDPMKGDQ